jgi:hypothetical protein
MYKARIAGLVIVALGVGSEPALADAVAVVVIPRYALAEKVSGTISSRS